MLKVVLLFFSLLCVGSPFMGLSQSFDQINFANNPYKKYDNQVYDSHIKTVQIFRKGWNETYPVIDLNDPSDRIHITFDDLNDHLRNLGYTFIHCTADWLPSDLMKIEYIDGIENNSVENYGFSATLYQPFVKYDLTFPNRDVQFTKSGNYLLIVYDQDNNNKTLLTRRFFVADFKAFIQPDIKAANQARYRYNSQEVDFTIVQNQEELIQPFSSLKVVVVQNQNWDGALTNLKPKFINGRNLIYDYEEENIFPGGNEFRLIDIRNINYNSISTERIATVNDTLNAYIFKDEPRSSKVYLTTPDINGHFYIKNDDIRFDSDLESDYVKTHLSLAYPAKLYKADLYVYGQLTGWALDETNKMKWNAKKNQYEISLYLKQGYYNYMYMYRSQETGKSDISIVEGSHAQTTNSYSFFVYYREPGQVYDRLIGFQTAEFPTATFR